VRDLIFPTPEQPLQYRAIGLIRGKYLPSQQQFGKGTLLTSDGIEIDAVILGQLMNLAQKYLDLEQEQWWVVYPRTRTKPPRLHVQIQGVRNPKSQSPNFTKSQPASVLVNEPDAFSIRGEVVEQNTQAGYVIVKIRQAPRKPPGKAKVFRLRLEGFLPPEAVERFWDLQVQREGERLVIQDGQPIARITHRQQSKRKNLPVKKTNRSR
jgi:hypothetical protein